MDFGGDGWRLATISSRFPKMAWLGVSVGWKKSAYVSKSMFPGRRGREATSRQRVG
jgi:hypothetical protein